MKFVYENIFVVSVEGILSKREKVATLAMVLLVSQYAPSVICNLRKNFPGSGDIFEASYRLGTDSAQDSCVSYESDTQALLALIGETVAVASTAISNLQLNLSKKLEISRNVRLVGSIIATVCGAGSVASLSVSSQSVGFVVSVLALIGAVATLIGEAIEKPLIGGGDSVGKLLSNIMVAESELSEIKLRLLVIDPVRRDDLVEIAKRTNSVAATIRHASIFGGVLNLN